MADVAVVRRYWRYKLINTGERACRRHQQRAAGVVVAHKPREDAILGGLHGRVGIFSPLVNKALSKRILVTKWSNLKPAWKGRGSAYQQVGAATFSLVLCVSLSMLVHRLGE